MGIFVNRGNASFAKARKSQIYVDKSGMLEYTNSVIDRKRNIGNHWGIIVEGCFWWGSIMIKKRKDMPV